MKKLPVALFFVVALAASAVAAPNTADLSAFRGNFKGKAKVEGAATYKGDAKIHGVVPSAAKSMRLKIKASVKVGSSDVPVDNELQFRSSGKFIGKELIPGTGYEGQKFKGKYKVNSEGVVEFKGHFRVGSTNGTFEGTAKAGGSGMNVTYSVTVKGDEDPAFVYTYYGKK